MTNTSYDKLKHRKMKKTLLYILCLLPLFGLFESCDVINPAEEIPAYVYIDTFSLNTSGLQGTSSAEITDGWFSAGQDFLGAYDLPALIPVLQQGETQITLEPGIKDNGISLSRDLYPFYQSYQISIDLQPNEVDTIRPVTTYRDDTKFGFVEEFESENQQFREIRIGDIDHRVRLESEGAFEGATSGLVTLDEDQPIVEIATAQRFTGLTDVGVFVYLEVNYKSDVPVLFGVVGHNGVTSESLYDAGFLPTDSWSKIYFNLSPLFFQGITYDEYQVVFQAAIPIQNGELTRNTANIWLDNVKLLHF